MNPHIGYESMETWQLTNLKWKKIHDPETKKFVGGRITLICGPKVIIVGVSFGAGEDVLGARSALAWIIDRC